MKGLLRTLLVSCVLVGSLRGGNSQANALLIDGMGRILTAGFANNVLSIPSNEPDRTTDFALARYLPDGSLDPTFNPGGEMPGTVQINIQQLLPMEQAVVLEPIDEGITAMAFDQTNKIVVAGFASVGLNSTFVDARLNDDGTLDTTFNASGQLGSIPGIAFITFSILNDLARGVAIDSQNRIVVVGSADNGQNIDLVVVRLTSDGMLDPTFNPQSPVVGSPAFNFTALTTGALPESFRSPGVLVLRDVDGIRMLTDQGDQSASAVALTADDRIIVGGSLDNVDFNVDVPELNTDFLIVKLTTDGSLDTTFNAQSTTPGIVTQNFQVFDDESFALKLDANNRIVIGGLSNSGDLTSFGLARYNENGTLDLTFNADGQSQGTPGTVITTITSTVNNIEVQNFLSELRGLAIQTDKKIIATGLTDNLEDRSFVTVRYTEGGALDPTFSIPGSTPGIVITAVQPSSETLNDTAINAENQGHAVALGANNSIYVTGFSNNGVQNNFTTINYLETGAFNTAFNPTGQVSSQPGIVITPFGDALSSLGNGVPIEVTEDLSGVSPSIIKDLAYPPLAFEPTIFEHSLQAFTFANRTLAGQASPHAVVSVFINEVLAATTTANKAGVWQVTTPFLADGTYKVSVVSIDPLSGVSLASQPISLTVNNLAPAVPVISTPQADQRSTSDMMQFTGTAQPGSLVTLSIDDTEQLEATTQEDGTWRTEAALPDGPHRVTAQAVNIEGSVSGISEPLMFEVDTRAAVPPKITSPNSGATVANSTIYIRGTGQPESEISVTINGTSAVATVSPKGTWAVPLVDPSGAYEVQAAHDGRTSEVVRFTVTHAKQALSSEASKGLLSGRAEPESRVSVYFNGKYHGSTAADTQGVWSYSPTVFPANRERVTLKITDKTGKHARVIEKA